MQRSLFTRLSTYSATARVRPLENFTTELLAWAINYWPAFAARFAELYLADTARGDVARVYASTQRSLSGYGIIDLSLNIELGKERSRRLLLECKVEAEVGERDSPDVDEGSREVVQADALSHTQIDNYLAAAAHATDTCVGLLTKYRERIEPRWAESPRWAGACRWIDVGELLGELLRELLRDSDLVSDGSQHFLATQMLDFFREHGMILERVQSELVLGTRCRQALWDMLEEAAANIGRDFGLSATRGYDRWAIYVTWKDSMGKPVARLAYSDGRGDSAISVDPARHATPDALEALRAQPELEGARGPNTQRFWGRLYVPVLDFSEDTDFFTLDAKGQLLAIETRCRPIIQAIMRAQGESRA